MAVRDRGRKREVNDAWFVGKYYLIFLLEFKMEILYFLSEQGKQKSVSVQSQEIFVTTKISMCDCSAVLLNLVIIDEVIKVLLYIFDLLFYIIQQRVRNHIDG